MTPGKQLKQWTNHSVLEFAGDSEPVLVMEQRARRTVLAAMDAGWTGPPFDPIRLATLLGIETVARQDVADARTILVKGDRLRIEFNPMRPRGRLRFSIAHEIAHTFFSDCGEAVRNRGGTHPAGPDSWQLEVICNIGAAELLMPMGSFASELKDEPLRIQTVLALQKRFDVSIEALMLRMLKLTDAPAAVFCASFSEAAKRYRVDYLVPSRSWTSPIRAGLHLPVDSVVADANAIGFTAIGNESWTGDERYAVECVGLAPYPGSVVPRVIGFLVPIAATPRLASGVTEVVGDALAPRGKGPQIVAHIVPDIVHPWGGRGFAFALRKRYPSAWQEFREQVSHVHGALQLGSSLRGRLTEHLHVLHMVAQSGFGPSTFPRIRYSALESCLEALCEWAVELRASVHLPRIGTGEAGGRWELIRELIEAKLVARSVNVTIYNLPEPRAAQPAADQLHSAAE